MTESTPATISTGEVKRFRLLIIGKTGCGKTTILSKVCGKNMIDAPSTSRGVHNIENEILFQKNDKLVAHDSEGFESGQSDELDVVKKFIERRSKAENMSERLHMVWYCIEMNPRPVQHSEREFFSNLWEVPVLAIITKFDVFVQDVLQELEEAAEAEGNEIDDELFEEKAKQTAKERFDLYYKIPLKELPYPPKTVLALSETDKSTPNDSRLATLIEETLKALTDEDSAVPHELGILFASAQTADVRAKLDMSICVGMSDMKDQSIDALIEIWNTSWSESLSKERFQKLVAAIKRHVEDGPRMIGHPASSDFRSVSQWHQGHLSYCRYEQIVAERTLIMEQLFLTGIEDEETLERLLKWYSLQSTTARYIRNEIRKEEQARKGSLVGMPVYRLREIVLNRPSEVPVGILGQQNTKNRWTRWIPKTTRTTS